MKRQMGLQGIALLLTTMVLSMNVTLALSASREETRRDGERVLENLYAKSAAAKLLGPKAKGILVFPHIVKAGTRWTP